MKADAPRRPLVICAIGSSSSTHVVSRVRCFAERGHTVHLICEEVTGIPGVTEWVPAPVPEERARLFGLANAISLRLRGRAIGQLDTLRLLLGFVKRVRELQPDIVHVHYAYSTWGWMAPVTGRHPLVVSVMGGDVLFAEQGSPTPRGIWLTRQLLRSADLITAKSDYLITVLDQLGGFGRKAIKVVWGVDLKRFRRVDAEPLRTRLGLKPGQPVILSPKILKPFYNVYLVVEALPRILAAFPEARVVITEYGADQDYKDQILSRITALGLEERVLFVGQIPHAEMPEYYSLADVSVAVPSSDGLPQTLLEGLGCEVPNILSRLPRYEEVVQHGQSAWFVDSRPEAIAAGVVRLLQDGELRHRLTRNGLAIVREQGDFDREVARVEDRYYELLAGRKPVQFGLERVRTLREVLRYFVSHV